MSQSPRSTSISFSSTPSTGPSIASRENIPLTPATTAPPSTVQFQRVVHGEQRRPSIQFTTAESETLLRTVNTASVLRQKASSGRKSPPPPPTYENRVSFDTFDNKDATDFSFTLRAKHRQYNYSKRSRTFLCGTDQHDYSEFALEWLLDELVDDGDEVVVLRVVDKDDKTSSMDKGRYKIEAQQLMNSIQSKEKSEGKSINLILEFAYGKVHETIQRMIAIYEPACLIVGTRGRSLGGIQGLLPGSVSKYCLQNSPVPVVVVRPSSKREKKKRKRAADPSRRAYMGIMERSGSKGIPSMTDAEREKAFEQEAEEASLAEADAVANAIGVPAANVDFRGYRRGSETQVSETQASEDEMPMSRVVSGRSEYTSGPESPSPTGPLGTEFPFRKAEGGYDGDESRDVSDNQGSEDDQDEQVKPSREASTLT